MTQIMAIAIAEAFCERLFLPQSIFDSIGPKIVVLVLSGIEKIIYGMMIMGWH